MGEWDVVKTEPVGPWDVVNEQAAIRPVSTVTGKPVPTMDEKMTGSRNFIKFGMETAGDVLGTMLAPQFKAGKAALPFAKKALNLLARAGGAGTGGGLGNLAGQAATGQQINPMEAALTGALSAGGEVGISGLGAAGKAVKDKALRPSMEFMSDITFSGSAIKKNMRDKLIKKTTGRASNFVKDIAPPEVAKQITDIDDVALMAKQALDEDRAVYSAYEESLEKYAAGNSGVVELDDTAQMLGEIRNKIAAEFPDKKPAFIDNLVCKELGYGPGSYEGIRLKKLMHDDIVDPKVAEDFLAKIFKTYGKDGQAMRANKDKLKGALMSDLDKIAAATGGSVGDIKRQADETFKAVKRFQFVSGLFDKAMREIPETGEKILQPYKLAKLIYANKPKIKELTPELWPKLKAEAEFYKSVAPEFSKQAGQYISGPGTVISRGVGGAAGGFLFGSAGVPMAEGLGTISAWALMSQGDRKLLSKVIGSGAKNLLAKPAVHMAGQAIDFEQQPQAATGEKMSFQDVFRAMDRAAQ